ncbi:hypothetical protein J3Q64DRAFT_1866601 [Phycomyces blakesleeanus]|uniref:F-box domain-containing protein n=1 Tax=Phycomyces blakesleeanus TaxID=4837 RepID=A0ABR3ASF8_PHYBL
MMFNTTSVQYLAMARNISLLQLLLSAKQFFPCLKTTNTRVCNNAWLLYLFYGTLQHFNVKTKNITICFEIYSPEVADLNTWIKYFPESVNTLCIFFSNSDSSIHVERKSLVLYSHLTVLRLSNCRYIDMENILDHCRVLRLLHIANSEIQSPEYQHSTHLPHPLQTLEIAKTRIDIHVFKYISFRCRQLKYMTLLFISYRGSDIDKTRQILVDMPFSQLKLLKAYGNQKSYSLSPNLIVIEQMGNDETDQGHAPQLNWYHLCVDTTNRRNILLVWELGRCDIEFCQRYLKDFGRRREFEEERNDTEEYDFSYKLKRFWKRDLQLGVLILRFKSVEDYFIDEKDEYKHTYFLHKNTEIFVMVIVVRHSLALLTYMGVHAVKHNIQDAFLRATNRY